MIKYIIGTFVVLLIFSCIDPHPNQNEYGEDIMKRNIIYTDMKELPYQDTVYIPIYSDIYSETQFKSILLTATLSIRSTSLTDTTFIHSIDYYNTEGELVKSFIENTLVLHPMQSIDYVIERTDTSGGTGANFLVVWGADENTKPLFQAVMISTQGQHGISFVTEGVSIKR